MHSTEVEKQEMGGDHVLMLAMAAFVIWTLLGFPGRGLVVSEPEMGVVTSSSKNIQAMITADTVMNPSKFRRAIRSPQLP